MNELEMHPKGYLNKYSLIKVIPLQANNFISVVIIKVHSHFLQFII